MMILKSRRTSHSSLLALAMGASVLAACEPPMHGDVAEIARVHGEMLLMDRNVGEGKPTLRRLRAPSFRSGEPTMGILAIGLSPAHIFAINEGIAVERLTDRVRCSLQGHRTLTERGIWRSNEKWVVGANWDEAVAVRWSDCNVFTFRGHGRINEGIGAVLLRSEFVVPSWEGAVGIDLDSGQERIVSDREVTHLRYLSEDMVLVATHSRISVLGLSGAPNWSASLGDHRLAYTGIAGNDKIIAYRDFYSGPLRVLDAKSGIQLATFESAGAGVAVLGRCAFAPRAERGVAYLKMWSPARGVKTVEGSDTPWFAAHLYPLIGAEAFAASVAVFPDVIVQLSHDDEISFIRGNWSECLAE